MTDYRQFAPATQRNREAIASVLQQALPSRGCMLEIASGTGEHAQYFASRFPSWDWFPSDPNPLCRESIQAWRTHQPLPNLHAPLDLDVTQADWATAPPLSTQAIASIVAINMIHIAPWSACLGLVDGARQLLPQSGILYLYGPYRQAGVDTAPSNEAFDQSLQARNPEWGLRSLETVTEVALAAGFVRQAVVPMPANNLSVVFAKS